VSSWRMVTGKGAQVSNKQTNEKGKTTYKVADIGENTNLK
jgi:hypothetical protein